jgi:hypothetical protein
MGKPSTFNLTGKIISKPQVNEIKPTKTSVPLRPNQAPQFANATDRNRNMCPDTSRSHKFPLPVQLKQFTGTSYGIGIKSIVDDPFENKPKEFHQTPFVTPSPKFNSLDPFDDDDDDDLLCAMNAIAEEVESQYGILKFFTCILILFQNAYFPLVN